jgi:hypothetical protein
MTLQALVIVGMLVVVALALALAAVAVARLRSALRARALDAAEEADRLRNDPNGRVDHSVYRWQAKGSDTARNFPGSGLI